MLDDKLMQKTNMLFRLGDMKKNSNNRSSPSPKGSSRFNKTLNNEQMKSLNLASS